MSSSITSPTLFSGQTYQMPGQSATSASSDQSGSTAADSQASIAQSMLAAISSASGSSLSGDSSQGDAFGDAYSLSPSLQAMLQQIGVNTSGSPAGSSTLTGGNGFLLTPDQQQAITTIIAKYKDAPFTQDTFNQIQADLKAAGLSPDQLSLQDEMRSFSPTTMLLNALNGQQTQVANPLASGTEQSNANAYMQQIFNQWQGISTTAGASTDSSGNAAT